ncbi:unnamed protein product [Phytophthora fragariaefolia]|uniref:Unnamed protein product n=1 Tax=Phytophthora fragariaefolia TaxID=1490495 RepID=A0A9W7D2I0_9STRA|nr:unnamed protein product [Phytophthora fragariaefolia]
MARVERFDKYESSLIAHVSTTAQEAARAPMRAEALGAAQASTTTGPSGTRSSMTKPAMMAVPTFDGKDSDRLVFWVWGIEIALNARQIYDARAQVAFALSNLGGRARAWAMARETASPGHAHSVGSVRLVAVSVFDGFDSVEPFIGLDMDDRYDLILGMPWLAKHEPWTDWYNRTIGASHKPLADRALSGHAPSSSRDGFVHEHRLPRGEQHVVGTSEVLTSATAGISSSSAWVWGWDNTRLAGPELHSRGNTGICWNQPSCTCPWAVDSQGADAVRARAGRGGSVQAPPQQVVLVGLSVGNDGAEVGTRAEEGGRVGAPITQGVGAGSAHAGKHAVVGSTHADVLAGVGNRAENGNRVGAPTTQGVIVGSARAKGRGEHGACAPKDETLPVLSKNSPTDFLESLKAGELEEVVLVRAERRSVERKSSSVMDPVVLEPLGGRCGIAPTSYKTPQTHTTTSSRSFQISLTTIFLRFFRRIEAYVMKSIWCQAPSIVPQVEVAALISDVLRAYTQWEVAYGARLQQVERGNHTGANAYPEEGYIAEQHGGLHSVQCTRHGRWLLSAADVDSG